jgi:hypothetical protein
MVAMADQIVQRTANGTYGFNCWDAKYCCFEERRGGGARKPIVKAALSDGDYQIQLQ